MEEEEVVHSSVLKTTRSTKGIMSGRVERLSVFQPVLNTVVVCERLTKV